jgi:outer membrane protein OmpA-like peptidoglycan-associated protein
MLTQEAYAMRIYKTWFATLLLVVLMAGCADKKGIFPGAAIVPGPTVSSTNPAKGAPEVTAEGKIIVMDKLVMLDNTHFNFDQSALAKEGERMLQQNIKMMQDNPTLKVRIAGYASAQGTTEYNQGLSERRADAVMAYLIHEGGIAPSRLDKIGNGETRPSIYEENPEEIASNVVQANMKVLFEVNVK